MGNVAGNLVMIALVFLLFSAIVSGVALVLGALLVIGGIPLLFIWGSEMPTWAKVGWTFAILMVIAAIL